MKPIPNLHCLTRALVALALLPATMAMAAPVVTVAGDAAATAGGIAGTSTNYNTPPAYAGQYSAASNSSGYGSGMGWASTTGAYAVSATSSGVATSQGNAQLKYTLVNDTGVGQNYTMSFHIYGGSISAYVTDPLTALESLGSAYSASVSVDGVQKFVSSAHLDRTSSGISFTKTGTALSGDDGFDGQYLWSAVDVQIDLGFLAAGASTEVLASVSDSSYAAVGRAISGACPATFALTTAVSDGDPGIFACSTYKGSAYAFYGDPASIGGTPINPIAALFTPSLATVPEPASLALSGLALGLAAAATRRRRHA